LTAAVSEKEKRKKKTECWKKEQWFQLMQMVVTLAALSVTSISKG
jgi:hypothetical protein